MLKVLVIITICLLITPVRAYNTVVVSSNATLVNAGQKYVYKVHIESEGTIFTFYDPNGNLTAIDGTNVNASCYLIGHRKYTCHMYTSGDLYFTLVPDDNYNLCSTALNPIIEPTSRVELLNCSKIYLPLLE